ncbi:MAG: protein kinase [Gemmataceae bacterium]|nr:protein kinase [Gemmataceae bacterium]
MSLTNMPTGSPADALTTRTTRPLRQAVALVVGIGDYLHGEQIDPLRFAAADAQAVARALANPDIGAFPPQGVELLTDQQARRDDLVSRLSNWLPAQSAGAELALIYFAGHGAVKKIGPRKDGYLLPHDADPNDLVTRGVAMRDVAHWIKAIEAKAVVVCLDCCHAGGLLPRHAGATRSNARHLALSPAAFRPLEGQGRILIASCHEGQVSFESAQLGHGLFTHHLLEGMTGRADLDGDGKVGVAELFEYVAAAVRADSLQQFGSAQEPWKSATEAGGVYLTAPRGGCRPLAGRSTVGRWSDADGSTTVRDMEQAADTASPDELLERLRQLERHADPSAVPVVFRCLAHPSADVRRQAARVRDAIGWGRVVTAAEGLARRGETERVGHVLDGLNAIEAHPEVVTLLERLVALLGGDLLVRAGHILRAKQLSLGLGEVAALFERIHSPYRIEDVLGAGRLTAAYLARDEDNGLRVVVRVLLQEFTYQPQVVAHFLALCRRAVPCVHHNLVLTREARSFPEHRIYYTVRDYIDGVTLQRALQAGKRYEPPQIVKILRELLDALALMHGEGCTHGGVTPSNIFLRSADQRVVLGDPAPHLAGLPLVPERLLYDFRYASPEVFPGAGTPLPQSDLYAVGCVAHELCCGAPPFVSDNFFELATLHTQQTVPRPSGRGSPLGPAGDALLLRLLAKSPAGRFANARDALDALKRVESSLQPPDGPGGGAVDLVGQASLARYQDVQSLVAFDALSAPASAAPPPEPTAPGSSPAVDEVTEPTIMPAPFPGTAPLAMGAFPQADFPDDSCSTIVGPPPAGMIPRPPTEMAEGPPQTIGRYEIRGVLGIGSFGTVYRAVDPDLNREVALKVLRPERASDSAVVEQFLREGRAAALCDHPHIVPIYDIGRDGPHLFIVSKYIEGPSLAERVSEGPLDPRRAAEIVRALANGLASLHEQHVVHRDIKPANILLDNREGPRLTDFGIASLHPAASAQTDEAFPVGTPAYIAPEQLEGRAALPASDQYSLGAVLYELLCGRRPFLGPSMTIGYNILHQPPPSPRSVNPRVPRALEAICLRAMARRPEDRYPSCHDLAADLQRFLDGRRPEAYQPRLGKRLLGWVRRRPVGAALAGACTLAALAALALWAGLW